MINLEKNLKKNENKKKLIVDRQKMIVNPSNVRTNYNSMLINSLNDNNYTSNNFDFQNSKVTEPITKIGNESSIKARKAQI